MMNKSFPSNLIILGEGEEREKLENLIYDLEISENVKLPGFVPNPQDYLRNQSFRFVFIMGRLIPCDCRSACSR
jgi:glycosyltransferase involved in cell wall biosynthesis